MISDAFISLVTETLLIAAMVVAVCSYSLSGLVFILPMAAHYLLKDSLDAVAYFASSGLIAAMAVCLIIKLCPERKGIMWLALASIVANLIGLGMWAGHQEPYLYATLFIMIYLLSILIMGKGDAKRDDQHSNGVGWLSLPGNILHQCNFKRKEEP